MRERQYKGHSGHAYSMAFFFHLPGSVFTGKSNLGNCLQYLLKMNMYILWFRPLFQNDYLNDIEMQLTPIKEHARQLCRQQPQPETTQIFMNSRIVKVVMHWNKT